MFSLSSSSSMFKSFLLDSMLLFIWLSTDSNIDFTISFDLIIETESNHRFKSNISLNLPTGNILEDGVGTLEDTEMKDVIFKRF